MNKPNDIWIPQFIEGMKRIANLDQLFKETREIEYFDQRYKELAWLNATYEEDYDLEDAVTIGKACIARKAGYKTNHTHNSQGADYE